LKFGTKAMRWPRKWRRTLWRPFGKKATFVLFTSAPRGDVDLYDCRNRKIDMLRSNAPEPEICHWVQRRTDQDDALSVQQDTESCVLTLRVYRKAAHSG